MVTKKYLRFTLHWLIILLLVFLLLSACSPTNPTAEQPEHATVSVPAATLKPTSTLAPTATMEPTMIPAPTETMEPEETAVPASEDSRQISLNTGSVATSFETETIAAVAADDGMPYWALLPEYTQVTLQDYPISDHLMMPQIFIYPVQGLEEVNESTEPIVTSLQTLLQSPQEIPNMPFLPLFNAQQVMHAHVQYLDFQSGQGLRYLTEFDQGIVPINNYELIYTYQGLTSDGKFYVAAILPVHHPSLPTDTNVTGNEPPEFSSDFPAYLANVTAELNPQAANTFTPDLTRLDAMMSSLEIK